MFRRRGGRRGQNLRREGEKLSDAAAARRKAMQSALGLNWTSPRVFSPVEITDADLATSAVRTSPTSNSTHSRGSTATSEGLTATDIKVNEQCLGDISSQYRSGKTLVDVKGDTNSNVSTKVIVDESFAGAKTKLSFKLHDQKSSKASSFTLYMPEVEDAVAHGDANLAVDNFLTRSL
ncbi:hypothetical protein ZIOFF_025847 [Zingiber officinale]|uniref:Uncharacterized protein n=1 Tax=Zingiber officinale TaxID=94328 RepID=A0A8J5HFV0_ZINOF|nr:hypothetical protein ZIOFF_025847 [Zingiber officinale]